MSAEAHLPEQVDKSTPHRHAPAPLFAEDPIIRLYSVLLVGFVLRVILCAYEPLSNYAATRLELSTPVTSWKSCELIQPQIAVNYFSI